MVKLFDIHIFKLKKNKTVCKNLEQILKMKIYKHYQQLHEGLARERPKTMKRTIDEWIYKEKKEVMMGKQLFSNSCIKVKGRLHETCLIFS